jgi:AraC family transcriptional regulator
MTTKLAPGTFFGQTRRYLEVSGLTIAESTYEEGFDAPVHYHANAFFYLVIEGVCEESCGGETRSCGPSTLVFHPAGHPHSNRWRGAVGRVLHIDISGARAESLRACVPALDNPLEFRGGVAPWLAGRLYREYLRTDGASPLSVEGLTLEILAEVARDGSSVGKHTAPRWLHRARDLLQDRFAGDIALSEVATEVGIHPVHLARAFRRHYGCSPGDYVRRLRVEFACQQLASSDTPLAEIALSAGFSDQSHLTKAFRLRMRMTPGEFRKHFGRA